MYYFYIIKDSLKWSENEHILWLNDYIFSNL